MGWVKLRHTPLALSLIWAFRMDKRFQVFISSTFHDLELARQEVSQALLRADCFPAGMELFPAADEEQFEFIKGVIEQSDYYLIITAGRYGSLHPETGLSYTEMEYDYAIGIGKPIIRLLHKDPFNALKGKHIERTDDGKEKLETFRAKLTKARLVRYWSEPSELMAEAVFGLQDAIKRHPATGWVKADGKASVDAELEIAQLKQRVAELELASHSQVPDYSNIVGELEGHIKIVVEDYEGTFDPKPTGEVFEDKISLTQLALRICVGALQHFSEYELQQFAFSKSQAKSGFGHMARSKHFDEKVFKKLLWKLEEISILTSTPYQNTSPSGLRSTGQNWYLTDNAKKWISGIAARDEYD
jgi:hypothetical protein